MVVVGGELGLLTLGWEMPGDLEVNPGVDGVLWKEGTSEGYNAILSTLQSCHYLQGN